MPTIPIEPISAIVFSVIFAALSIDEAIAARKREARERATAIVNSIDFNRNNWMQQLRGKIENLSSNRNINSRILFNQLNNTYDSKMNNLRNEMARRNTRYDDYSGIAEKGNAISDEYSQGLRNINNVRRVSENISLVNEFKEKPQILHSTINNRLRMSSMPPPKDQGTNKIMKGNNSNEK